jgi:hypothetical protein
MSFTIGDFTFNDFIAGLFSPRMTGAGTDDYVFNWTGQDAEGNNGGTVPVTVTDTGLSHNWQLSVSLESITLTDPDTSSSVSTTGSPVLLGKDGFSDALDGGATVFSGVGASALESFIHSLHVDAAGAANAYRIHFSFQDVDGAASNSWDADFVSTACFGTDTRIAIPGGEVAVEDLRIGDLVMTATGVAKKVKWLGRRSYTAAEVAAHPSVRSVLVRANAIAPGMPHRDLTLSPMHGLFIADCFVPAVSLVNGVTILRNDELAPVSYIHVEMDEHDVVFANGLPAETFVDDASRQMFDNADEYYTIYGADQGTVSFSAPRLEEGMQLEALRRRIAARAGLPVPTAGTGKLRGHVERLEEGVMHGWVIDTASGTPVELEILVDGEVVARAIANRYRVDLDHAGIADGRGGFSVALPASVTSLRDVTVRRTADGAKVAVPEVALAD